MSEADGRSVRVDVWLWRARMFKTRALACRFVEEGRVRLIRSGRENRLCKASRCVGPGDLVVFACAGRVRELTVMAIGERRGPATEARGLYAEALTPAEAPGHEAAAVPGALPPSSFHASA